MKTRFYKQTLEPFGLSVSVVFADTVNKGIQYINKNLVPELNLELDRETTQGLHICKEVEGESYDILIFRYDAPLSTIIHECFHLVMHAADYRGAKWGEDSDEFYAYSMGNFTSSIISKIPNKKKI